MDEVSAKNLREYVSNGGTAIMTAFSAKVDEHANWFETPLPGRLSDVFGLKTNAFYQVSSLKYDLDGQSVDTGVHFYEVLEPTTSTVLARFNNTSDKTPAITVNNFGKGKAVYLATESKATSIAPVLKHFAKETGVTPGPQTPDGVYARVVDGRTFYVNTNSEEVKIPIIGSKKGILSNRIFDGTLTLGANEAELLE
jgi:beta-galactosidase